MFFTWIDDTQWVLDQDALLNTEGLGICISPTQTSMGESISTEYAGTNLSFTEREKTTVLQALNVFVSTLNDDDDRRQLISSIEQRIERLSVQRPQNEL